MDEEDLRDCFAMFALTGLITAYKDAYMSEEVAERAYHIADTMLKVREYKPEGIAAIKKQGK